MTNILDLYEHNIETFEKVKNAFEDGESRVAILQATGTGKSYVSLRLAYEYKDKKVLYISPSEAIIEHLKSIITNNPNLNLEKDFPNLEFRTYQSLINLSREELSKLDVDLLITDELHHLGAPVWGKRINDIVETHPNMLLFGLSAYTVRDRGTIYERDMTNPETEELFSGKVVSNYDLCDAMIDGVLPKPVYKSAYTKLLSLTNELEDIISKEKLTKKEYEEIKRLLEDTKRQITKAPGIPEMVRKNVKKTGKYIYFCPSLSEENKNDIDTIMEEAKEWFKDYDVIFYKTTSKDKKEGQKNREAFYNDKDLNGNSTKKKLRIMFAINQYNEGVHAPDINGVILGRATSSDIVYFEQIGRALSVKGKTKEQYDYYETLSREELIKIAKEEDIEVKENITKDEIIERLLSPIIIDLTNNIDFIEELQDNLKDRVKEVQKSLGHSKRQIKIRDVNFDIEIENKDLFEILRYVRDRLRPNTWDLMYNLATAYYNKYNNLEIPQSFKTLDGINYNGNGYSLGMWINTQRKTYKSGKLIKERIELLNKIGMRFENKKNIVGWEGYYKLAKIYFEKRGDLEIPYNFKTLDGINYGENGYSLGVWIKAQRQTYKSGKLSKEKIELLNKIGIRFENKIKIIGWEENYKLAKAYYNQYNNLEIPNSFKTLDGISYDKNGYRLGVWINAQRQFYKNGKLIKDKIKLLDKIGMRFENRRNIIDWEEYYNLAQAYYNKNNNLEIPYRFKTLDGITYDEGGYILGVWINNQRQTYKSGKLNKERIGLLEKIGMRFENKITKIGWQECYKLAKVYFEKNNNLEMPHLFKTLDGINYNENGYSLGVWIAKQRQNYKNRKLSQEKIELLDKIDMRFENKNNIKNKIGWKENYKLAKVYFEKRGNLEIPSRFKTLDGINYDENGYSLGTWIIKQRQNYKNRKLNKDKIKLLEKIGMLFSLDMYEKEWMKNYGLAEAYFNKYNNLEISKNFKTIDGITYDENGYNLERWIYTQRKVYRNGKLGKEKIELLDKIGMRFENKKNIIGWEEYYKLAKVYFEKNNNLEIPKSFKTLDGITYDEKGHSLGAWLARQRKSYKNGKLNKERIELLDKIGMVWSIKKEADKKNELCEEYQIPYEEVENISYQELYAKTMYLIDNNIPVTNNGILNPIYNMSNINMEIRYKVTLEELINKYQIKDKKRK